MLDVITDNLDIWTTAQKQKKAVGRGRAKKDEAYGIKKLRELILELAVRGKLVPQDVSDEPASVLLERIAEEKQRLTDEGKIKKQKALSEILKDEKPFELPNKWKWGRLGDISNYGISDKVQPDELENDVWVLELEDIEKESSRLINKVRYVDRNFKSSKNQFNKGDVIYGKLRPYLDKVIVADEDGVCTTEMIPVRVYTSVTPQYLRLVMKSPYFIRYANNSTHGMNLPRMGTEKARLALIPIIPENEQHRIVAKVDELMALCDQLEQEQADHQTTHQTLIETLLNGLVESAKGQAKNAVNDQQSTADYFNQLIAEHFDTLFTTEQSIDHLKQTILQLAVMGKLVPQDLNDEPASVLLEKIAEEKTRLIEVGEVKKYSPVISFGEKYIIPESWENIVVQDFADVRLGSTPSRTESKYWNGEIPWVSSGEVAGEKIYETNEKITQQGFENSSVRLIPENSLLIAIIGQGKTRGQSAILGRVACTNQNVAALVFNEKLIVPEFVWLWARSKYESHRAGGHGGAQPALNGKKVRSFIFYLPPFNEQHRIVTKVNQLLTLCDSLKANLNQAQTTQTQLADAIVKQAIN